MKVKDFPYTNPIVSHLYGKPPLAWRDVRFQCVVYETDIENIRRVIPEPLEPRTNKVITWVSDFALGTTQGVFGEAALYVQVKYKDMEGDYEPFLYVASHLPLTGGREIWGYQKKMAEISLHDEYEAVRGQVNRLNHQIIKALVVPEFPAELEEMGWSSGGLFSLKYIPSAEEGEPPLRQLVLTLNRPEREILQRTGISGLRAFGDRPDLHPRAQAHYLRLLRHRWLWSAVGQDCPSL
jgi:hypothetical protein